MSSEIDFVITWLNSKDPKWISDYKTTKLNDRYYLVSDYSPERFRDWDNLKYWFRGVDEFAPWVRKIHFITYGHIPEWLDTSHPKLNIVKHSDYIPAKYLPTFNSRVLEINLPKLASLSENFVLFNDDFFLTAEVEEEDFFINDSPCDSAILNAYVGGGLSSVLMNNLELLNRTFSRNTVMKENIFKWFNFKYGKNLFRSFCLLPWPQFTGFIEPHLPQPYKKSNLNECFGLFKEDFERTCTSQFRLKSDINHYLFRYYHLAKGEFHPQSPSLLGKYFDITSNKVEDICGAIESKNVKVVVINDSHVTNFNSVRDTVNKSLDKLLNSKCAYEND